MIHISPCGIEVRVGQTWEEVDPRHPRKVTVVGFKERWVLKPDPRNAYLRVRELITCVVIEHAGRKTHAQLARFTGKRGGYRFASERAA